MAKRQIKITPDEVRRLIREEIDAAGYNRYPEGVFSTDSEEGEALKDYARKYDNPKKGNSLMWDPIERKLKDAADSVSGEKWADTIESSLDSDEKRDKIARDEFGDKERESKAYDENPEGEENLWASEPGHEEEDDEEIAGLPESRQIRLNEEGLRNFVSYSVARLLRESEYLRASEYGSGELTLEIDPWSTEGLEAIINEVLSEAGLDEEWLEDNDPFPVKVRVSYNINPGSRRDYRLDLPGSPDEPKVTGWEFVTPVGNPTGEKFARRVLDKYFKEVFNIEDELAGQGILREENNGIKIGGFGLLKGPESKYKHEDGSYLKWEEYCQAKEAERAEDKRKEHEEEEKKQMQNAEVKDEKPNRGIMFHCDGKKHERTPEEIERDEHMFDDNYWVNKMNFSKDELSEIVKKTVKRIMEEMGAGNEEEQVADNFPKKASGTFTMRTRRGNVDKYKVYVEKTEEEALLTDIFVYDERGKEWEPQAEYVVGIEEYTNGSWLPYWETFNGDVSIRALANCFDKVVKLWKKVGYLYDEDDEIPFRYSGDYMKGAPKGMF